MNLARWVVISLLLAGCSQQPENLTECESPRPQFCTREYRPVCATRDTGVRCVTEPCDSTEIRTYGNACDACVDDAVQHYREGACEGSAEGAAES